MIHCVHHVPGRIRVKSPQIKNSPDRAQALERFLFAVDGVGAVSASTITGSVVIRYAVEETSGPAIMDQLRTAGFLVVQVNERPVASPAPLPKSIGQRALDAMIEKVIERSAVALITALI
ncbi:MAG: HMA2 domain-containing protein [Pseudomonadota bacterium]